MLPLMTMKSDPKFKEKLCCSFKYVMRNFVNFHPNTQNFNNFTLIGYFCSKHMNFELKKYRGVIFRDTEEWCKIWLNPDFEVSKMKLGIGWAFIRALKVWRIVHWWAQKLIMFQLENFRGIIVMTLKGDAKFKGKLIPGLKNYIRNLVNFHASSRKSRKLQFDGLFLSKA